MDRDFKVGFVYPGYENIGIEYLSANLLKHGYSTRLFLDPILFDESGFIRNAFFGKFFSFEKQIIEALVEYCPDAVCISIVSDNYKWASKWAALIKSYMNVSIVVGGIHPSSVPEEVIQNENFDYVCVGEGDEAIVDLMQAIKEKTDTDNIQNVWSRRRGEVVKTVVRQRVQDLDSLPFPDKEMFYSELPALKKCYSLITSRGCPFVCSYCCNNVWKEIYSNEKKSFRKRSIENVVLELQFAKHKFAPRHIAFLDEVFNADREWLFSFLREYKVKIGLPFSCYVYPDLMDSEIAVALREAGCIKVQMGLQVIDEQKRSRLLHRKSSNKKVVDSIVDCKKVGIFVACDVIFGLPEANENDLDKMVEFFCKTTPDHIEIFWLRYYPKTEMTSWAMKEGLLSDEDCKAINQGIVSEGIVREGKSVSKREKKTILLFYLLPMIPESWKHWLVEKERYLRLPSGFSYVLLYVFKRLVKKPKYDINTEQTLSRYITYSMRKMGIGK